MDECPFCGEPIEEDATFCRHCGSDAETGWNPDSDYLSLELPEDDDEEDEEIQEVQHWEGQTQLRRLIGPALVVCTWLLFVIYGYSKFQPPILVLIPATYLALSVLVISRLAPRARNPAR